MGEIVAFEDLVDVVAEQDDSYLWQLAVDMADSLKKARNGRQKIGMLTLAESRRVKDILWAKEKPTDAKVSTVIVDRKGGKHKHKAYSWTAFSLLGAEEQADLTLFLLGRGGVAYGLGQKQPDTDDVLLFNGGVLLGPNGLFYSDRTRRDVGSILPENVAPHIARLATIYVGLRLVGQESLAPPAPDS